MELAPTSFGAVCGAFVGCMPVFPFGYGCGLFCGSGGVLLQNGKDSGAVKVVAQFPGGNGLRPVRREVGKPPPALLDSHALPQQQRRKLVKAGGGGKGFPYGLPQLLLVRFKFCG